MQCDQKPRIRLQPVDFRRIWKSRSARKARLPRPCLTDRSVSEFARRCTLFLNTYTWAVPVSLCAEIDRCRRFFEVSERASASARTIARKVTARENTG